LNVKHNELKARILSNPKALTAFEGMRTEFSLLRQLLKARAKAGLSQAEVAKKMGTQAPAITRLESALISGKHSPSLATLQRYAKAVGCELEVKLVKSHGAKA
jgi:transcriptional regulator with XRE-family HTH domain